MFFPSLDISELLVACGVAISGAAALWGWIFAYKARVNEKSQKQWTQLSSKMMYPLLIGFVMMVLGWGLFSATSPFLSYAYEGVDFAMPELDYVHLHDAGLIPFMLLIVFTALGIGYLRGNDKIPASKFEWFYFFEFAFISLIAFIPMFIFLEESFYLSIHAWLTIFTFGTVVLAGYLFVMVQRRPDLLDEFLETTDLINKIVWFGLGLEFLNSFTILEEQLILSPRFYFLQIIVAIIILNGVLILEPATRRLREKTISKGWDNALLVGGAIGFSSWFTLIFIDSMLVFPFSITNMMIIFGIFTVVVWTLMKALSSMKI